MMGCVGVIVGIKGHAVAETPAEAGPCALVHSQGVKQQTTI